jgi:hypothetical protein
MRGSRIHVTFKNDVRPRPFTVPLGMIRIVSTRTILLVNSDETVVVRILYEWGDAGSNDFTIVEALELREAVMEEEFFFSDRAVSMFTHENIGYALPF